MSKFTTLIVISLTSALLATATTVSAVIVSAPGGSGPYTAGPFTVGTFQTPADLGLTSGFNAVVKAANTGNPAPAATVGNVNFAASAGEFGPNLGSWGTASFSDPGLNTLSSSYAVTFSNNTRSTTVTGLSAGRSYRAQIIIWDGDSGDKSAAYRGTTSVTMGVDTLTNFNDWLPMGLAANTPYTASPANKGVFINYGFVATGTSILLSTTADSGSAFVLQGFDVLELPEPGAVGAMAVIGCAALARRRRSLRAA